MAPGDLGPSSSQVDPQYHAGHPTVTGKRRMSPLTIPLLAYYVRRKNNLGFLRALEEVDLFTPYELLIARSYIR